MVGCVGERAVQPLRGYFDLEWDPPEAKLRNTVLLPVLGDHYGRVLEAGELRLEREEGSFVIHYHDQVFPVSPRSLNDLLATAAERCQSDDLACIADGLGQLPMSTATDWVAVRRRHRNKEVLRGQLARLCREQPKVAAALDQVVAAVNSDPDQLDVLLERQNYRLAFWRTAAQDLGYRRFSTSIRSSACVPRMKRYSPRPTHSSSIGLEKVCFTGYGSIIQTVSSILKPTFSVSMKLCPRPGFWRKRSSNPENASPSLGPSPEQPATILSIGSPTFVDPAGEGPLTKFYAEFTDEPSDFAIVVREKKAWRCRSCWVVTSTA